MGGQFKLTALRGNNFVSGSSPVSNASRLNIGAGTPAGVESYSRAVGAGRLRRKILGRPGRGGYISIRAFVQRRLFVLLAAAFLLAVLFVAVEVAENHFFPGMTIGTAHALLTLRAVATTAVVSVIVYLFMWRHQRRLADTAESITSLIRSYAADRTRSVRFENPNAAHFRDGLKSSDDLCGQYDSLERRCWQVVALRQDDGENGTPESTIEKCQKCPVYAQACPDELAELGESFNSLMFLLEEEGKKVGLMRSQLVEKEKMVAIGQMASGIAHEVCNPLSSISSTVQMLARAKSMESHAGELMMIQTHIQRISTIVRQMVTLARPDAARWGRANIGFVLSEALHLIRFDKRAKDVDINVTVEDDLPETYVLEGNIEQVFINLSLNALDAMQDGGKLTIRAGSSNDHIEVKISDTGDGIDPDIGRRVFEPFFTTKEPGRGTGLGLAVSYSLVRKHGGHIEFQDNPDGGTVFTVTLPILRQQPDADYGQENGITG